jgi:serine protease
MEEHAPLDRRTFLKTTGVAGAAAAASSVTATSALASATPGRTPGPKESEVLVGVADSGIGGDGEGVTESDDESDIDGAIESDIATRVSQYVPENAEVVHSDETLGYVAVQFSGAASDRAREDFVATVTDDDHVEYAEENATYTMQFAPSDPKEPDQSGLDLINAQAAWDTTTGSHDVTVAVLANGVDYEHPDLAANFGSNPGKDFHDDDSDPAPDAPEKESHGTHISGIVGAEIDNDEGVAGVSQSRLLAGRVVGKPGSGALSDIVDGVRWAADQGADVITMPLSGSDSKETMKKAVSYAHEKGCLLVCQTGNSGDDAVEYPAAYEECLAVTAVDSDESLADFSNTGDAVDLTAPGEDTLSTTTETHGSYERRSGTGKAAAYVAGVAALVVDRWNTTNETAREHLKNTARDLGLAGTEQGAGLVDAKAAVQTNPPGTQMVRDDVEDSLSGYFDADCWTWTWEFDDPSEITLDLDGPADADFDLYVNDGEASCPDAYSHDYHSTSDDSQESVVVENPDTSTPLYVSISSYSGSGEYTLTIREYE